MSRMSSSLTDEPGDRVDALTALLHCLEQVACMACAPGDFSSDMNHELFEQYFLTNFLAKHHSSNEPPDKTLFDAFLEVMAITRVDMLRLLFKQITAGTPAEEHDLLHKGATRLAEVAGDFLRGSKSSSDFSTSRITEIAKVDEFFCDVADAFLDHLENITTLDESKAHSLPFLIEACIGQYERILKGDINDVEDFVERYALRIEESGVHPKTVILEEEKRIESAKQEFIRKMKKIGGTKARDYISRVKCSYRWDPEPVPKDHWRREAFRQTEMSKCLRRIVQAYRKGDPIGIPETWPHVVEIEKEGLKLPPPEQQDWNGMQAAGQVNVGAIGRSEILGGEVRDILANGDVSTTAEEDIPEAGIAVDLGEGEEIGVDEVC